MRYFLSFPNRFLARWSVIQYSFKHNTQGVIMQKISANSAIIKDKAFLVVVNANGNGDLQTKFFAKKVSTTTTHDAEQLTGICIMRLNN